MLRRIAIWLYKHTQDKPKTDPEYLRRKQLIFNQKSLKDLIDAARDAPLSPGNLFTLIEKIAQELDEISKRLP
jgi:hypothetical protein